MEPNQSASQLDSGAIIRNDRIFSERANFSRRSVDWRDSGVVIDEDYQYHSFEAICGDYTSAFSKTGETTHTDDSENNQQNALYSQDDDGDTILHLAVVGLTIEKVKDLVKICDINAINNMIQTPMHVATMANRPEIVDLLLKAGAQYHVYDRRGNTPLHLACQKGNIEIVKTILDFLGTSIHNKDSSIIVQRHIETANFDGQTCLHLAATHKQKDAIKLLVQNYAADINFKDSKSGESILHKAIASINVELVRFILDLSSSCAGPDYNGRYPADTVRVLMESRLDQTQIEKLSVIKGLIGARVKLCIERNGCCTERYWSYEGILDSSSSSSDYSDSDSDMN